MRFSKIGYMSQSLSWLVLMIVVKTTNVVKEFLITDLTTNLTTFGKHD